MVTVLTLVMGVSAVMIVRAGRFSVVFCVPMPATVLVMFATRTRLLCIMGRRLMAGCR
jgi:hypothetical protein